MSNVMPFPKKIDLSTTAGPHWKPVLPAKPPVPENLEQGSDEFHDYMDGVGGEITLEEIYREWYHRKPIPQRWMKFSDWPLWRLWFEHYRWNLRDFLRDCVWIHTKAGQRVKLDIDYWKYKRAQHAYLDLFEAEWKRTGIVRISILKARQWGGSTLTRGIDAWIQHFHEAHDGLVVADTESKTVEMQERFRYMMDEVPHWIRGNRATKAGGVNSNHRQRFGGFEHDRLEGIRNRSSARIGSAGSDTVSRSQTPQRFHGSECAFWKEHAEEVMTGSENAVPDVAGTYIIYESTAWGWGGAFFDAVKRAETGHGGWRLLFIPWHMIDEYSLADDDSRLEDVPGECQDPVQMQKWLDAGEYRTAALDPEEQELVEQGHVNANQILWRRWCLPAKCQNSIDKFHQEYPATIDEAFLSTGTATMPQKPLQAQLEDAERKTPNFYAVDIEGLYRDDIETREWYKTHGTVDLAGEVLAVWKKPQPFYEYIVGADPSGGAQNWVSQDKEGDNTVLCVICRQTSEVVARMYGRITPDRTALMAWQLVHWYNNAWIIPENNGGYGSAIIELFTHWKYPRLYNRKVYDNKMKRHTVQLGWNTNMNTRWPMITNAQGAIRVNQWQLSDPVLISELLTLQNKKGANGYVRVEARDGEKDDVAFAFMMAIQYDHELPPCKELERIEEEVNYQNLDPRSRAIYEAKKRSAMEDGDIYQEVALY